MSIQNFRNAAEVCKEVAREYGEAAVPVTLVRETFGKIKHDISIVDESLTHPFIRQYNATVDTLVESAAAQAKRLGVRRVSFKWLDQAVRIVADGMEKGFEQKT